MTRAKVALETYGCTLNQADSDIIEGTLINKGYEIVSVDEADIIIINTCTVKGPTENRIVERIKSLEIRKRETGSPKLVFCGCMAANSEKLRKLSDAPIVWPGALANIGEAVEDALCGQVTEYKDLEAKDDLARIFTKPIMRIGIAEGCTSNCHFCQTKLARPGLKSLNPQRILQIARESIDRGAKEIQLTAMDTGAYGLDLGYPLPALLKCVDEIEGNFFVRLGMINPDHVKRLMPDLIESMKGKHIYKFLHIPVQSGSEKVCKEMGRKHTVEDFVNILEQFRAEIPDITIATDIIVGYPTETEGDFEHTLKLLEQIRPDVVNLSKFSARPGTAAKELAQLHNDEIKRRSVKATEFVRKVLANRNDEYVGKEMDVLITEKQRDFTGRTPNYKQVVVRDFVGELGARIKVEITDANHGSLFGEKV
jgi:MiaB-like tRNA modifying enzyme